MSKKSRFKVWGILIVILFVSCGHEPRPPYIYEQNPEFTYMGVSFFGRYYEHIPNYVFSFFFLTDNLWSDNDTDEIVPVGQFLFIEDVFVPSLPDELLETLTSLIGVHLISERAFLEILAGEYQVSGKVGSENFGNPFTFAPGELFTVDGTTYTLGARITYLREIPFLPVTKLITEGSFTISPDGVVFNFVTESGLEIGGRYLSAPPQTERKIKVRYHSERELESLR